MGCQFHPEFKSRPMKASPPFYGFVLAAAGKFPAGLTKRASFAVEAKENDAPAATAPKKARRKA